MNHMKKNMALIVLVLKLRYTVDLYKFVSSTVFLLHIFVNKPSRNPIYSILHLLSGTRRQHTHQLCTTVKEKWLCVRTSSGRVSLQ